MINLMEGVVNQGTAGRLRWRYNLRGPIAGKTGTTQNHSDGWFMGIVPNLVGGVWVGAEDRAVRFQTLGMGSGGNMALPIFALFLEKVHADPTLNVSPNDQWSKPLRLGSVNLNCDEVITREEYMNILEEDFF